MSISKNEALSICYDRLDFLKQQYNIEYEKLRLSQDESIPGDNFDAAAAKKVNEYSKRLKVIFDKIRYLQSLPHDAIIGEEET